MQCPESLALSVTALAIAISEGLSAEDAALLSAVAVQLEDTLALIAAAKDRCEKLCSKKEA